MPEFRGSLAVRIREAKYRLRRQRPVWLSVALCSIVITAGCGAPSVGEGTALPITSSRQLDAEGAGVGSQPTPSVPVRPSTPPSSVLRPTTTTRAPRDCGYDFLSVFNPRHDTTGQAPAWLTRLDFTLINTRPVPLSITATVRVDGRQVRFTGPSMLLPGEMGSYTAEITGNSARPMVSGFPTVTVDWSDPADRDCGAPPTVA